MFQTFAFARTPWMMAVTIIMLLGILWFLRRELNQHAMAILDLRAQVRELKDSVDSGTPTCQLPADRPCFPDGFVDVGDNDDDDVEDGDEDDDDCLSVDSNQLRNILNIIHEEDRDDEELDAAADREPQDEDVAQEDRDEIAIKGEVEDEDTPQFVDEPEAETTAAPPSSPEGTDILTCDASLLAGFTSAQLREFLASKGVGSSRVSKDVLLRKVQDVRAGV